MKAISLWQPWATWCVRGYKTIETRGHTRLCGLVGHRVLIHASKRWTLESVSDLEISASWMPEEIQMEVSMMEKKDFPLGAIVGSVLVVDFIRLDDSDEIARKALSRQDNSRYGLVLEDAIEFEKPVPYQGQQGIFFVNNQSFQFC